MIIPAYKLEGKIGLTVRKVSSVLEKLGVVFEIVVVDDGSPDHTYEEASEALDGDRVRVLRYGRNRGKGFALLYGFRHCHGDLVVFFDGDLDIHEKQIAMLLRALDVSDCVVTSKWHRESKTVSTTYRKLLSIGFNLLTRVLTGLRLRDTQTGGKAFRRKVLEETLPLLTVKRYAFDVELLTAITAKGYKILEIPAFYPIILKRRFSTLEIFRMFLDLIAIAYRHRIKRQYSP